MPCAAAAAPAAAAVGEDSSEEQRGAKQVRAADDVADGLSVDRMSGEKERGRERGFLREPERVQAEKREEGTAGGMNADVGPAKGAGVQVPAR